MPADERQKTFTGLRRPDAEDLFVSLGAPDQAELLKHLPWEERRSWLRIPNPDGATDLIQQFPESERPRLLELLDADMRIDVIALLAYADDVAGGLMNPRFTRLRPEITVDVAVRYLRAQVRRRGDHIYYAYVIDRDEKLVGVVSFRELLVAQPDRLISDVMKTDVVSVPATMDQEEVGRRFAEADFTALPVVDENGRIQGIVTADDVVNVVEEEATEDIQKLGGMEALGAPYLQVGFLQMIKKRAGWLTVLFVSEMFTATAMGFYQNEIEQAVVLALFLPLIISSGGNSGSQASTLIIRAMALGEVRIRDWWKVLVREASTGLALGAILGAIGLLRIFFWPERLQQYGQHYALVAFTVGCSLIGVVLWGTLAGSMLPFALRRLGFDPASASAPFVATLVDVTGIVIYFTVASVILHGVLL